MTEHIILDPDLIFQAMSVAALGAFGWAWRLQTRIAILETKVSAKENWIVDIDSKLEKLSLDFAEMKGMLSQHLHLSKE